MSLTKVTLSAKEQELVQDTGFILTKNAVIQKVYTLFGDLSEVYKSSLQKAAANGIDSTGFSTPKIARGEQYEGLPWVMLDYPRQYLSSNAFGIRSFFWWGNFGSITLQLSGDYQQRWLPAIQDYFETNDPGMNRYEGWFLGKGENPWLHHFREDNFEKLSKKSFTGIAERPFIKLAKKASLSEWDALPSFYANGFGEILMMLTAKG